MPEISKATQPSFLFSEQHKLFTNFLAHTTQEAEAIRYLQAKMPTLLENLGSGKLRYLDVGCGYGTKTTAVIDAMGITHQGELYAFDPSQDLLDCFAEEASKRRVSLTKATLETFPLPSELNLITSIHVFYYVNDWPTAITSLRSALSPKGQLCISLRSNDEVCAFKDHFLPKIQGREVREKTSNYLEEVLASMKISYSTDFVESKLDVSAALNREADGLKLIEFLLRTPFESIKNSLQEEIMQYLHDRHSNGSMKHRDGFVWIGK